MNEAVELTPKWLFAEFRKKRIDLGKAAIRKFRELDKKKQQTFLKPTIEFLSTESEDMVRSWGTSILQIIDGEEAFQFLVDLLQNADSEQKQNDRYTRFFALRAIDRIATTESRQKDLLEIIDKVSTDKDEQGFIWAGSLILLSTRARRSEVDEELKKMLKDSREYWGIRAILRALREFPHPGLTDEILAVMRDSEYLDLKSDAIRTLRAPEYQQDVKVIRALGEIIITDPSRYLRLEAVNSLAVLQNREAGADLLQALKDPDAEIQVQASNALVSLLQKEGALSTVVQQALREEGENDRDRLVEAIRRIDPDRRLSADMLSKELSGEDRGRSQLAEKMLIDLGGWTAVQRLSQRRSTLDSLDKLLEESERVVKSTFNDTIRQARFNFYFAMIVNALVVVVGIALIVLAIAQLVADPAKLQSWIIPGGAGVLGIIINLGFNNPRRNARQDLATLMNVNVIFLGYLRQLNEIDATFKHAFIEDDKFGPDHMQRTVEQIEKAMFRTLNMAARHLYVPKLAGDKDKGGTPEDQEGQSDT